VSKLTARALIFRSLLALMPALLLCAANAYAQRMNPALLQHPELTDPTHSADQARLIRLHQATTGQLEQHLSSPGAVDCTLTEDAAFTLAMLISREHYEASLSLLAASARPRITALEATLVEGQCMDGWPEGDFVAVTRFETEQESYSTTRLLERRRVTGSVTSGRLHGELVHSTVSHTSNPEVNLALRNVAHGIRRFADGEPTDRATTISFLEDGGNLSQIVTNTERVESTGVVHLGTWAGSMLSTEMTVVNGQSHGWVISHPVQYVRGFRTDLTRMCYQHGQPAGDAACGEDARYAHASSNILPRPRLRRGPERDLLEELEQISRSVLPGTQADYDAADSLCILSDDVTWTIAFGELADSMRARGDGTRLEAKVLSGQCANGSVSGPFEAMVRAETPPTGAAARTIMVTRVTGELRNDHRQGRWVSARTTSVEEAADSLLFSIADFSDNALSGPAITFIGYDTRIERPTREPRVREFDYYMGDFLRESATTRDGYRDGTSTTYVRNARNVVRCFREGAMVSERACRRRR
jgi:hypothetical protein